MQWVGRDWLDLFKPKDRMVNVIALKGLFKVIFNFCKVPYCYSRHRLLLTNHVSLAQYYYHRIPLRIDILDNLILYIYRPLL